MVPTSPLSLPQYLCHRMAQRRRSDYLMRGQERGSKIGGGLHHQEGGASGFLGETHPGFGGKGHIFRVVTSRVSFKCTTL